MALNPRGSLLVSGSHDRSIRLFERTSDPVHPHEEREMVSASALRDPLMNSHILVVPVHLVQLLGVLV